MLRGFLPGSAAICATVLLITISSSPARADAIFFNFPVGTISHEGSDKASDPECSTAPCDTFTVDAPIVPQNPADFPDDLANQNLEIFLGTGTCVGLAQKWETDIPAGLMKVKMKKGVTTYTFKGSTLGQNDVSHVVSTVSLNFTVTLKANGHGTLKASGTADLSGIPDGSMVAFGLRSPGESPPEVDNDVECGDLSTTFKQGK